jgi:hypothetical protein
MADFYTQDELDKMKRNEVPEGFERIPSEHYPRYLMMAQEQIAYVSVTVANILLQVSRPGNPEPTGGARGGCQAGLERAIMWLLGFRKDTSYVKPIEKKDYGQSEGGTIMEPPPIPYSSYGTADLAPDKTAEEYTKDLITIVLQSPIYVEINGERMTTAECAKRFGVDESTLHPGGIIP